MPVVGLALKLRIPIIVADIATHRILTLVHALDMDAEWLEGPPDPVWPVIRPTAEIEHSRRTHERFSGRSLTPRNTQHASVRAVGVQVEMA
tara:strand:+ start:152 stop:424 length:273 start_codon:yes stop_codon:yes gene_type:complete